MLEPILGRFGAYLRVDPARRRRRSRSSRTAPAPGSPTPRRPIPTTGSATCAAPCASPTASRRSPPTPDRVYLEVGPGKALSSLAQAHGAVPVEPGPERRCATRRSASPTTRYFLDVARPALGGRRRASTGSRSGAARGAPRAAADLRLPALAATSSRPAPPRSRRRASRPMRAGRRRRLGLAPALAAAARRLRDRRRDRARQRRAADLAGVRRRRRASAPASAARLRAAGHSVIEVRAGDAFAAPASDRYVLAPERGRERLRRAGPRPRRARHGADPHRAPLAGDRPRDASARARASSTATRSTASTACCSWRRRSADENLPTPAAHHRRHLGRGAGARRAAALPREGHGARPGPGDPARAARRHLPAARRRRCPPSSGPSRLCRRSAGADPGDDPLARLVPTRVLEELLRDAGRHRRRAARRPSASSSSSRPAPLPPSGRTGAPRTAAST